MKHTFTRKQIRTIILEELQADLLIENTERQMLEEGMLDTIKNLKNKFFPNKSDEEIEQELDEIGENPEMLDRMPTSKRVGVLLSENIGGTSVPVEAIVGGIGILLLLDATRRAIGIPLVIICSVFLVFSIFGQSMPDLVAHKGVSLERLIGYQWFTGEAIFGIPIDVSVSFVFLFVLFGALLEKPAPENISSISPLRWSGNIAADRQRPLFSPLA